MSSCCKAKAKSPCGQGAQPTVAEPLDWFENMVGNCYEFATQSVENGVPLVGIMCEYTPREIIMAAGALPVCLCGGSQQTVKVAEKVLPASLCPLIKSTYGYHLEQSNPFLEMSSLVVGETTCDGKKKIFELMGRSREVYVLELPQKSADPDGLHAFRAELAKFRRFLAEFFGVRITDARIREASLSMNRERALRRRIAALMKADCPPLTGLQLLSVNSIIGGFPCAHKAFAEALAQLKKAPAACTKGRKRVLLTGVPHVHGAEKVVRVIEEQGGLVVAQENCTGLKPILDDVDTQAPDILLALAQKYYDLPCSVMTPNERRFTLLRKLCREYKPDCIIDVSWQCCLTYELEALRLREFADKKLGLPLLHLTTDYSPADSGQLATRIGALLENLK